MLGEHGKPRFRRRTLICYPHVSEFQSGFLRRRDHSGMLSSVLYHAERFSTGILS